MIIHTGDFKVDYTPLFGDPINLGRFGELGKKGVLALLCDSTNAGRPGYTMSERKVAERFNTIFSEHTKERIIVATFASNVDRVQQIINTASIFGRKVVVEGRSMVNVINTASELGYLTIPKNTLIEIDEMKNYTDEQLVLVMTGSQGESMAALSRIAASTHRKIGVKPGDVIIFSSTPIPGNQKAVSKVVNELTYKGAKVIVQDTHVSGHACREEIKLMYALTRPQYAVPIHGEFKHRMDQIGIAEEMGVPKDNAILIHSGNVLELSKESAKVVGNVQTGCVFVDGLGIGDVGNIVLRDRQQLSQNGLITVLVTLEKGTNQILSGPDIVSRGFVYIRESEQLMSEIRAVVDASIEKYLSRNRVQWGEMKTRIREDVSDYLWKKMKRTPVVLPIIMEV